MFDIGANEGYKTEQFLKISKKVVAIDPDNKNNEVLIHRYGKSNRVFIEKKAVDNKVGTASFNIEKEGSPVNTLSDKWIKVLTDPNEKEWNSNPFSSKIEVEITTLDELISKYGTPDFIKIDVEGYEINVIKGLTKKVPLIDFEANLPVFADETIEGINYLNSTFSNVLFNIYADGDFVFDSFVESEKAIDFVKNRSTSTIEVFFKIS